MPTYAYLEHQPRLGAGVVLEPSAVIAGKVSLAGPARLGPSAVIRGDQNQIEIGPRFCMGARATIHVEGYQSTQVGANVWLGDDAVAHACVLGDGVRVEAGGLVLSTSRVGAGSIVAADALVAEGAEFGDNSYISGTPGRRLRDTTPEERAETLRLIADRLAHA